VTSGGKTFKDFPGN